MVDKIFLAERPHVVLQGEGPLLGQKMIVIRTYGCDVMCSACDSKHTWHNPKENRHENSIHGLAIELASLSANTGTNCLMVTGGNPVLQQEALKELFKHLDITTEHRMMYNIEDAGNHKWDNYFTSHNKVHIVFSPKMWGLKDTETTVEYSWDGVLSYPRTYVKAVVSKNVSEEELAEIVDWSERRGFELNKVFLMPLGITREEQIEASETILEKAWRFKLNFSPRLHILLFDTRRLV